VLEYWCRLRGYLRGVRRFVIDTAIVLIADEVMCGFGADREVVRRRRVVGTPTFVLRQRRELRLRPLASD